jgi:hypothetical protein
LARFSRRGRKKDLASDVQFFVLVIAIVAFIFARKAFNQVDALRARLDALEAAGPHVAATPVAPPPVPATEPPIVPSAADEVSTRTAEEAAPIPSASPPSLPDIPAGAATRSGLSAG